MTQKYPSLVLGCHTCLDDRQEGALTDAQEQIHLSGAPPSALLQSPTASPLHRLRPCCTAVHRRVQKLLRQYAKWMISFWGADLGGRKLDRAQTSSGRADKRTEKGHKESHLLQLKVLDLGNQQSVLGTQGRHGCDIYKYQLLQRPCFIGCF